MEVIHTDENGKPNIVIVLDEQVERQLILLLERYGLLNGDVQTVKRDLAFLHSLRRIAETCQTAFWRTLINGLTLALLGVLAAGLIDYVGTTKP